ncbi:MAG: ABC transporter permease [Firmicutes bacterium]|nr:ABC transporter permease [Bacillota bacterium]
MYSQLSLKNVRRSLRDYVIYFTTLALIIALIYSFLSLGLSKDIRSLAENMSLLTNGLLFVSILVTLISAFITSYAMNFILTQRKKEFATYMLMGMENHNLLRLFIGESIVIGILAFLIGTGIGSVFSGVLSKLVMSIFAVPYLHQFSFSFPSMVLSFGLFLVMYGLGLFKTAKVLRKTKIIHLLYDHVKNEAYKERSLPRYIVYLLWSVCLIGFSIVLIIKAVTIVSSLAILILLLAVILILLGLYVFYRWLPALLVKLIGRKKQLTYGNNNLVVLGSLRSRINSSGKIIAVIAILLAFSLATMFIGLVMGAGYKINIESEYPYDVTVAIDAYVADFDQVVEYIATKTPVKDHLSYYLYQETSLPVEIMALSDYNLLREQLGLDQKDLVDNQYLIHCEKVYQKEIMEKLARDSSLNINGIQLNSNEKLIFTEPMEQKRMVGTNGYVLVIPDAIAFSLEPSLSRLVVTLATGGEPELRDELNRFIRNQWKPNIQSPTSQPIFKNVTVKAWGIANSLSGFVALSFCGLYLSVVFIVLSCTVLGFEQLASTVRSRRTYSIIRKLGVTDLERRNLILKELSIFFLIPAVLPCILLLVLALGSHKLFAAYILQPNTIPFYTVITLVIFMGIYSVYFAGTYLIYSRAVGNSSA